MTAHSINSHQSSYFGNEDYESHHVALGRKFNNYDYQDLSDIKLNSSRSAKIRASISSSTIKSNRSTRSSKSAKIHREINRPKSLLSSTPGNNRRRNSSSGVSSESMPINMHSVALSSVHQKHIHVGSIENQKGVQTNYDKQKIRMYSEKKAFGPKTPYDMAQLRTTGKSQSVPYQQALSLNEQQQPMEDHQRQSYRKSHHHSHHHNSNHHNSNYSNVSSSNRSVRSQRSDNSMGSNNKYRSSSSNRHRSHHNHHSGNDYSMNNPYNDDQSQGSFHEEQGYYLEEEKSYINDTQSMLFDKIKSNNSTPLTSPENSPLNESSPKMLYHQQSQFTEESLNKNLTSIVEVATPKETSFGRSIHYTNQNTIPEETQSFHSKQYFRPPNIRSNSSYTNKSLHHQQSHQSLANSHKTSRTTRTVASPKAVFSLEDTLRADQDFMIDAPNMNFNKPKASVTKRSAPFSNTSAAPEKSKKTKKSSSNGGFWSFFSGLFSKKQKGIDKRQIEVINQRIGVC